MEYTLLTEAARADMLRQRVLSLETEHYGHQIAIDAFQTLPKSEQRDQEIASRRTDQETIEAAHTVACEELASLTQESTVNE